MHRIIAKDLDEKSPNMANLIVGGQLPEFPLARGGCKAHQLDSEPTG